MRRSTPRLALAAPALTAALLACPASSQAPARGAAQTAPAPVTVSVDWNAPTGRTFTRESAGVNGYAATSESLAAKASYARNVAWLGAGVMRYHYAGLLNDSATDPRGWTSAARVDTPDAGWDAARIARVMDAADGWKRAHGYDPVKMVTIPSFPAWMKTYTARVGATQSAGLLHPSEWDRFASFCAALVRILNVEQRRGVKYFEVLNELDPEYYGVFRKAGEGDDRLEEMVEVYARAARAMKAVDPTVRVGGPALEWPDRLEDHRRFVRGARDHLDFLSYHAYATGRLDAGGDEVLDAVTGHHARVAAGLRRVLDEEVPGRRVPLFLTEYNIQWNWRNGDPRMTAAFGAAYDALSVVTAVTRGVELTAAWNDRDGVYGKLGGDDADTPRPVAHALRLMNARLPGRVVTAASGAAHLVPLATKAPASGRRALLLVNRSAAPALAALELAGWAPQGQGVLEERLTAAGTLEATTRAFDDVTAGGVLVDAHAIAVLTFEDARP